MPLLSVAITLIVIGVLLWLVTTYIPMHATMKQILVVVVVLCVILWLLQVFGVMGAVNNVKVGKG